MKIYQLSPLGKRLARNTSNPDTASWRVLHELDKLGYATPDQLAIATGLEEGEVLGALGILKRKVLVTER